MKKPRLWYFYQAFRLIAHLKFFAIHIHGLKEILQAENHQNHLLSLFNYRRVDLLYQKSYTELQIIKLI